jgi:phenylalanyl-tRNA synthetase beta chain
LIEHVSVFDVYCGKPIPEDKKSISLRITYRSQEQTLLDKVKVGI